MGCGGGDRNAVESEAVEFQWKGEPSTADSDAAFEARSLDMGTCGDTPGGHKYGESEGYESELSGRKGLALAGAGKPDSVGG